MDAGQGGLDTRSHLRAGAGQLTVALRVLPQALPLLLLAGVPAASPCIGQPLTNSDLSLSVDGQQGSWSLSFPGGPVVVNARSGAEVDQHWVHSSDYPRHTTRKSSFSDALGSGTELQVTCSGLRDQPDLIYSLRIYTQRPYGTIQVSLRNNTAKEVRVGALRALEAVGQDLLALRGPAAADRVLSDSFSEDWPPLRIYDLGAAPAGMHRGVGSQLIYNRESGQSLFVG